MYTRIAINIVKLGYCVQGDWRGTHDPFWSMLKNIRTNWTFFHYTQACLLSVRNVSVNWTFSMPPIHNRYSLNDRRSCLFIVEHTWVFICIERLLFIIPGISILSIFLMEEEIHFYTLWLFFFSECWYHNFFVYSLNYTRFSIIHAF